MSTFSTRDLAESVTYAVRTDRKETAAKLDALARALFNAFVGEFPGYSYYSPTLAKIEELRAYAKGLRGES